MKDLKKCILSLIMTAALLVSMLAVYRPAVAQAAVGPGEKGVIRAGDTVVYLHSSGQVNNMSGLSYNNNKNTLTINNFNHPTWVIAMSDMGDINVVVKGTCKLRQMGNVSTCAPLSYHNSISLSGTGKLIIEKTSSSGILCCAGKNAKISMSSEVSVSLKAGAGAIQICRDVGDGSSGLLSIKGKATNTKMVYKGNGTFVTGANYENYISDGKTFTKTGTSGSSGVKAPGKVKITSTKRKSPNYSHGVVIKWKKISNVFGYQVQGSRTKSFKKPNMWVNMYIKPKFSDFHFGTRKGAVTYARVRAYRRSNGKDYYGPWSKVVKIKAK